MEKETAAASWLKNPGILGSSANLGADISYLFAVLFMGLFIAAWYQAYRHRSNLHHWMILGSMVTMIGYFLWYYEVRRLGAMAFEESLEFTGPRHILENVVKPILWVHFSAVLLALILSIYMLINGFKSADRIEGRWTLTGKPVRMGWPGKVASVVYLWILLFWIYGLQTLPPSYKILFFVMFFVVPALVIILIKRRFPDSARRHRAVGRITISVFGFSLITATLTYLFMYVIY
jgi:uncharacterized membrane protein YozB (DUF420 family)